jgi:hypothetical protein
MAKSDINIIKTAPHPHSVRYYCQNMPKNNNGRIKSVAKKPQSIIILFSPFARKIVFHWSGKKENC